MKVYNKSIMWAFALYDFSRDRCNSKNGLMSKKHVIIDGNWKKVFWGLMSGKKLLFVEGKVATHPLIISYDKSTKYSLNRC